MTRPFPGSPRSGRQFRWRHPRRAFALGLFDAYGPGPFEVVGTTRGELLHGELLLVVKTEGGEKEVEAACLGSEPLAPEAPAPEAERVPLERADWA